MNAIKVLLVDDETEFTASIKKVLSRRGFDVTEAGDGLSALPLIAKQQLDVVVLDVKMPGMNGITVLSEIKRFSPDTQVILLTGHFSLNEEQDTLARGAYAYLLKPYPILKLVDVIVAAASNRDPGSLASASTGDST